MRDYRKIKLISGNENQVKGELADDYLAVASSEWIDDNDRDEVSLMLL